MKLHKLIERVYGYQLLHEGAYDDRKRMMMEEYLLIQNASRLHEVAHRHVCIFIDEPERGYAFYIQIVTESDEERTCE
jgi:hypothetical protein